MENKSSVPGDGPRLSQQVHLDVNDLFEHFRHQALHRGQSNVYTDPSHTDENLTLASGSAQLRLRWHSSTNELVLETTHGPVDGTPMFWMDLYHVTVRVGEELPADRGISFEDALDYGLDLMVPSRGSRAAE